MKKNLFMVAAVALMALVSCNKEEINNGGAETPQPQEPSVLVEFTASIDVTKTSLVNNKTVWIDEDKISINGQEFKIHEIKEDGKAVFVNVNKLPSDFAAPFNAVYPYGSNGVPATQTAYANDFDPTAVIETAESDNYTLSFKNETSLLKFQVPAACSSVTLISDDALAGSDATTVTISGDMKTGTDYYVAVLPGEKKNFVVRIDGYLSKNVASVNIPTSTIANMKTLPAPISSGWSLPGVYNNWAFDTLLYEEGELYVAKSVDIKSTGFKFNHKDFGWKGIAGTSVKIGEWHKFNGENNITIASNTGKCDIYMTKGGTRFQAVPEGSPIPQLPENITPKPGYLYLNPNMWNVDNARFAAYFFGNGEKWVSMTDPDKDGIYEVQIPTDTVYPNVIFCRMNGNASANNWDNKWNQSGDLEVPKNGDNLFTPSDWNGATTTWSYAIEL